MSYVDVFQGSPVGSTDVAYAAYAPVAGSTTQLTWPELGAVAPIARIVRVTPGGAGAVLRLPQADQRSPGEDVLVQNAGADDVTVQDYGGSEVASVAAGEAKYVFLTDNSTEAGAWSAVSFGVGASALDAAQIAGPGMDSALAKLVVDFPVNSNTSGLTVTTADRGTAFVFTAGSATVALPAVADATDGFYVAVRNSGTGTVTVDPSGAETVDGAATMAIAPGESAFLVCSGGAWYSYGYGRSVAFAITQFTKDLTGLTAYTITTTEAANKLVKFVGSLSANCTVTIPTVASVYFLQNATSVATSETVTVKTAAGSGTTLSTGDRQVVYCDGVNVVSATTTTVSAPASIPAGSEGNPSIYFATDTDTGLYLAGANSFGISAGGTKRFEVSSTAATSVVPIVAQSDVTVAGAGTFNGSLVLPVTTTPAQTAEGSVVWDSNDDLLTVGTGAGRKTLVNRDTLGWVKIQTQTATNAASVTFTGLSSTYLRYRLVIDTLVFSVDSGIVLASGAGSYDGGNNYGYRWSKDTFLGVNTSGNNLGVSGIVVVPNMDSTPQAHAIDVDLFYLGSRLQAVWHFVYHDLAGGQAVISGGGMYTSAGTVDRVLLIPNSGNISGTFTLYGLL